MTKTILGTEIITPEELEACKREVAAQIETNTNLIKAMNAHLTSALRWVSAAFILCFISLLCLLYIVL